MLFQSLHFVNESEIIDVTDVGAVFRSYLPLEEIQDVTPELFLSRGFESYPDIKGGTTNELDSINSFAEN